MLLLNNYGAGNISWMKYLIPAVREPLLLFSYSGTAFHLKLRFQLKEPRTLPDEYVYSKVSSLMTSISGHTTADRFCLIRYSNGSSHPTLASQCASRNVTVGDVACAKPNNNTLKKN